MISYPALPSSLIVLLLLFNQFAHADSQFNQHDLDTLNQQIHQQHTFSFYPHAETLSNSAEHEHAQAILQTLYETRRHLFFDFLAQQLSHTETYWHSLLFESILKLFAFNVEQTNHMNVMIEDQNTIAISDALKYRIRHKQHPAWQTIQQSFVTSLLTQLLVSEATQCIDSEPPVSNMPKDVRRSHINCMARVLGVQIIDWDINESKTFSITSLSGKLGDNEKDQQVLVMDADSHIASQSSNINKQAKQRKTLILYR